MPRLNKVSASKVSSSHGIIAELISDKVIPSLVRFKKPDSYDNLKALRMKINNQSKAYLPDTDAFITLLVNDEYHAVEKSISSYFENDGSAQKLFTEFLTGCAQKLGDMWLNDECSFCDVTLGVMNIHNILHDHTEYLGTEISSFGEGRLVLLTTMPGATHILGISMLKAFFDAAGWQVDAEYDTPISDIVRKASSKKYEMIGISTSIVEDIDSCKKLIDRIRAKSLNPNIKILVGGAPFSENQDLMDVVGADATASNAIDALKIASAFIKEKQKN